MKEQTKIFFTALMFYTRIPCPSNIDHNPDYINKATRYFPLVGYVVAFIQTIVLLVSYFLFGNYSISILLMLTAQILTTGAFHEDGFADVCDGFGGGWTKEKILDIMKDSRVGAYGVFGSILLMLLKFLCFTQLIVATDYHHHLGFVLASYDQITNTENFILILKSSTLIFLILILINALSRLIASSYIFTHEYVSIDDTAKAKPVANNVDNKNFWIASFITLIPVSILLFYKWKIIFLAIPILYIRYRLGKYFVKWIGGYTGDCLGAVQQIMEVVILLGLIVAWKFI